MVVMVDYVSEITSKMSSKCSEYGSFKHLLFFFLFFFFFFFKPTSVTCGCIPYVRFAWPELDWTDRAKLQTNFFYTCHAYRRFLHLPFYINFIDRDPGWGQKVSAKQNLLT